MSLSLARILSKRPKGGKGGAEWIGRSSLPEQTVSMGGSVGEWNPQVVDLPEPCEEGLVLTLVEALVARCDKFWEPGISAVWKVAACQDDSEYVPSVKVFLDPHPPCLLCEACIDGNHWKCVEIEKRRWAPGWIAHELVVPP